MTTLLPPNENERLRTLQRYAILDTPPEAAFDRIVNLAARLLKVPIALVTILDANRQWFKACYGVDLRETSREISFCAHAILSDELMLVPDVTQDPRFADNPLVTGPLHVRFYAGVPLAVDGFKLGTLCVLDTQPREFGVEQQTILSDLANFTVDELRLRLAILEKNQLLAAIMSTSSGIIVTDPNQADNPIIFCNSAFLAMSGYQREEIVGKNCRFLQGNESDRTVLYEIQRALKEQRLFHGLLLNYRKDGKPFWNELLITPVFDQTSRLVHYVGIQNNVTERKQAEDALTISFEALKQVEGLRENLTNMIIHDLRSPLASASAWLDALKNRAAGKLDQREVKAINSVAGGLEQLNLMITSLLDVSRLEAGEMPLDIRVHDLAELTSIAISHQVELVGAARLQFELPAESMLVRCDADLVMRVITNLVGNALKFTPIQGKVRVSIDKVGITTRFSVIDTGPGIPTEYHRKIFEKFGQLEQTSYMHSTGLGLTFCKLAIEAQGGTIGIESEVGCGSTFWFSLP